MTYKPEEKAIYAFIQAATVELTIVKIRTASKDKVKTRAHVLVPKDIYLTEAFPTGMLLCLTTWRNLVVKDEFNSITLKQLCPTCYERLMEIGRLAASNNAANLFFAASGMPLPALSREEIGLYLKEIFEPRLAVVEATQEGLF